MAGLGSKCPRCGRGKLFNGFLDVAKECPACGLDYSGVDSGDGPAVFAILIIGFAVVGAALFVEIVYSPPYWVHAALWLPTIVIGSLAVLRPLKATLIALQYKYRALNNRHEE
ncbi:MAG: DUF983 domain-containing protein [Sphingomonadales bacterium]